jgi:hypothetical protein
VMASTCVCGALAKVPRRGRSTDADDEERKETEDCAGQKDGYGESHDVRVIALLAFPPLLSGCWLIATARYCTGPK